MDILIINPLMVLNLVVVNYELYRRNNDFGQFFLYYHWTATAVAATADCYRRSSYMVTDIVETS